MTTFSKNVYFDVLDDVVNKYNNTVHNNVKVDLSNYATKSDLKNVTHVDTSSFALKKNLASLKTEVDKLDIDKLAPILADLSTLSDAVKNNVVKKMCMIN